MNCFIIDKEVSFFIEGISIFCFLIVVFLKNFYEINRSSFICRFLFEMIKLKVERGFVCKGNMNIICIFEN